MKLQWQVSHHLRGIAVQKSGRNRPRDWGYDVVYPTAGATEISRRNMFAGLAEPL